MKAQETNGKKTLNSANLIPIIQDPSREEIEALPAFIFNIHAGIFAKSLPVKGLDIPQ